MCACCVCCVMWCLCVLCCVVWLCGCVCCVLLCVVVCDCVDADTAAPLSAADSLPAPSADDLLLLLTHTEPTHVATLTYCDCRYYYCCCCCGGGGGDSKC